MNSPIELGLKSRIDAALRTVIDPELGHNIVDLGMIYAVNFGADGAVVVVMTTTARFCPASGFLKAAVAECVGTVVGVDRVEVELTYDPPWSPDRMSPEIARRF